MRSENQKTILLVEDEVLIAITEKMFLEKYGYTVITASTGEKAVETLEKISDIDMVLMDINLGSGIDGTQAAKIILGKHDLPVVFLSSHTESEIVEKTEGITSYGYIVKNSGEMVLAASIKMAFKLFIANKRIAESELKYRSLIESSSDAIFCVDEKGEYKFTNHLFASTFGKTPDYFIGKTFWDIYPKEHADYRFETTKRVFQTGESESLDVEVPLPDKTLYFYATANPIKDEAGKVILTLTHATDITEHKRLEKVLQATNDKLVRAQHIAHIGSWEDYLLTNELYWSEEMYTIMGIASNTPITLEKAVRVFPAEELDRFQQALNAAIKEDIPYSMDYKICWLDGTVRYIHDEGEVIRDEHGNAIWMFGTTQDITERKRTEDEQKESEDRFALAIKGTGAGLWDWDMVNNQVVYSEQWKRMLGYEIHDVEDTFSGWKNLWHPDDCETIEKTLHDYLSGETDHYEIIHRLRHKDGSWRWICTRGDIVKDAHGKPCRWVGTNIDITERKQVEEALRSALLYSRNLIETSLDPMITISSEGKITDVNTATEKVTGVPSDKLIGSDFSDYFTDPGKAREGYLAVFKHSYVKDYPLSIKHLNGQITDVLYNASLYQNEDGSVAGVFAAARDITELKRTEAILLESEEKFSIAFKTSPYAITITGIDDGLFIEVNDAFYSMTGFTHQETENNASIGMNLWVNLEDRSQVVKELYGGRKVVAQEFEFKKKNGEILIGLFSAEFIHIKNNTYILSSINDITERKQAEEALRASEEKLNTLFGSMTEMIVLHELVFNELGDTINYRITDCNNAFNEVTGIKKENTIGKLATEVYQTETPPYLEEFSKVALTGKSYTYTTFFKPMDKYFSISVVSPKKNNFATITTDITEIKRIQEILSAKNRELENYFYIASHDLRSPLVNIQGFSQRLQKQTDSINTLLSDLILAPEIKAGVDAIMNHGIPKTLHFIFSSVTKMDTLLNGLLHLSRTGRILMTIKQINIDQLFKTIIGAFNCQLTACDATVTVTELPTCYGDENLLNQLFSNIIENAIKYRDKNRPLVIEITARLDPRKAIYSIRDNGLGIDPRYLEKIWNIFFRVDSDTTEKGEGLGLNIVKRIVEKHNGRVWEESELGKGSVFYVELQTSEFSEYKI